MKRFLLYNHAGCGNRGCEAIVRTTAARLRSLGAKRVLLASGEAGYDRSLSLPAVDRVFNSTISPYSFRRIVNSVGFRLGMPRESEVARKYAPVIRSGACCDCCLSVGGDTYCYGDQEHMRVINRRLREKGKKLVLWGASVEPAMLSDQMLRDLADYDLIVARESITWDALSSKGLASVLWRDPAFDLEPENHPLPAEWIPEQTIGLNVSPLVLDRIGNREQALSVFADLIRHILHNTTDAVALFSHVLWAHDNDAWVVEKLNRSFADTGRVLALPDSLTAAQIKGYVSRMRLLVTARTHASIAGYSSFVPTLVIGYSVKSKGIAKDLYGCEDTHVIDSHRITTENLSSAFDALNERSADERRFLRQRLPAYMTERTDALKRFAEIAGVSAE